MKSDAAYDAFSEKYAAFVHASLNDPGSVWSMAVHALLDVAGPVQGLKVCDLGCGEGTLTRMLAERGALVTGVDISTQLLDVAREQTQNEQVQYVLDDAQTLATQPDHAFDLVVSNLAVMDIPDLVAVYAAVHRVLCAGGRFVFAMTHPCFQSPGTTVETDHQGCFLARRIDRYATEGFWRSDYAAGIRGRVGAYHRTLSTVINGLINAGFTLTRLIEPTGPQPQGPVEIPSVLVIAVCRQDSKPLRPASDPG
ncbi:MAG: class I SAM-dependent methyltransferase [Anaerolineae bacterium]|nr:class I SAM-dependent methyltransferase [Anaerolineae bacterium]